ncbi:MAG: glycosyltransferase family 4 protein, partial [Deltaproteobacteria bacterium]|nr:glycosyltransferase family 4 protein [Deltaproteobacteria bacterium]
IDLPDNFGCSKRLRRLRSGVGRAFIFIPMAARIEKIDIFHSIDYVGPFLFKPARYVATVHDLIPVKAPELTTPKHRFVGRHLLPRMVRMADKVIAVSQATKNDLVSLFGKEAEKVKVVYEGVDPIYCPRAGAEVHKVKKKYRIESDYFLFIGNIEPRKNLETVLEAYSRSRARGAVRFVVAGKKGWMYEDFFRAVVEKGLEREVLFLGFVPDKDLPALLSGALFFAFPSLYEGFGLPVLEAMACGVPVITSNVSSLPEVVGDAAILIDPRNVEELAWRMEMLCDSMELRLELRKKGQERAKMFSWDKAARQTFEVYRELA